jgi:hypothetical protein
MPTQFLPTDVETALSGLLARNLAGIDTQPIGEAEIDDSDGLVLKLPCARPRYVSSAYPPTRDITMTTYDCEHFYEVWCGAEDLRSKEAQRQSAKIIVGQVLPIVAGALLALPDGSGDNSAPVRLVGIDSFVDDVVGMVYLVRIGVPGIAQFPGGAQ